MNTETKLYQCLLCGTRFEGDVADPDNGQPRCPQCFMSWNRPIDGSEDDAFVVTCESPFR